MSTPKCRSMNFSRGYLSAVVGLSLAVLMVIPAHAAPFSEHPLEPIDGAGVACDPLPAFITRPDLKLFNYDAGNTTCAAATQILAMFGQAEQKYATVGEWDCGINGAAEADRTGVLIRCVGPRGPLRSLQVEAPPA
ncbi:hypothetical protein [Mycolicibacterium pulveris]|uniref:hypothetical protein n=1 Tax=Mycolicibacterium pulveris TaxID=36813 RepID=UPI003CF77573